MPAKGKRSKNENASYIESAATRPVPLLPLFTRKNEDYLICSSMQKGNSIPLRNDEAMNNPLTMRLPEITNIQSRPRSNTMNRNNTDEKIESPDKKLSKRDRHIRAEHQRRLGLQERFQRLHKELPQPYNNSKLTKLEIVQKAAEYISSLQAQLAQNNDISTSIQQSFVTFPIPMSTYLGNTK